MPAALRLSEPDPFARLLDGVVDPFERGMLDCEPDETIGAGIVPEEGPEHGRQFQAGHDIPDSRVGAEAA
ncbi:MAG TPA: hypothetical protein VFB40_24035 [Actinocrinis sp.]|nr:hypothetical protein [Actinocrinis sp.]